jgi:hypothetical protein
MIESAQIPDEVVKAARHAFYNATGPTISDDWRTALAAGLSAWPRIEIHTDGTEDWIELTLMQENNNGSD